MKALILMKWAGGLFSLAGSLLILSCNPSDFSQNTSSQMKPTIEKSLFGTLENGQSVDIYTLTNGSGMEVRITNYGGTVVSLKVPDRSGIIEDVVLGYDSLSQYVADNPYFGSLVGRYGNRIAKGSFTIDGTTYHLALNNGPNHLHGGLKAFDKVVWNAEPLTDDSSASLRLTYHSPDMEEGYPGNLDVQVTYRLTNQNELQIEYTATTDKKTHINLTHHSYFNLSGGVKGDVLGHELMIAADNFVPVDKDLIPLGEIRPVDGSPFDFRIAKPIGKDIDAKNEQLRLGQGYDHNWVLIDKSKGKLSPDDSQGETPHQRSGSQKSKVGEELQLAATAYEPGSGRFMEVLTTEPGLQFYSGNFLDGNYTGKNGTVYHDRYGFCLETQHYPDSPNQPGFPTTILEPGQIYHTITTYRFSGKPK